MPGIKGRYHETQIDDDHRLTNATYPVLKLVERRDQARRRAGADRAQHAAARRLHAGLQSRASLRWNKIISTAGSTSSLTLPHVAFHRQIGEFKDVHATPDGVLIDDATWKKRKDEWLPSAEDGDFIASLMKPVTELGRFAAWIAPPKVGIDNKPGDFEYVKIET